MNLRAPCTLKNCSKLLNNFALGIVSLTLNDFDLQLESTVLYHSLNNILIVIKLENGNCHNSLFSFTERNDGNCYQIIL